MIGALAYSSFVLEAFFHTGISPLRCYVSELSVADRPYAFLFRAGDITAGCCRFLVRRCPGRGQEPPPGPSAGRAGVHLLAGPSR
ncbi:DUF998 domain-containing protein [Streptomyces sp. NPDC020192]|uniref:DUF998 domain-containing protein n=1 Tax=Streptomyces sp. NPDC020192 TaxID=3365066 RepID=UPI00379FCAB7